MDLPEIESTHRWDRLFADPRSPTLLARLAAEARAEDEAGLTEPLEDLLDGADTDQPPAARR